VRTFVLGSLLLSLVAGCPQRRPGTGAGSAPPPPPPDKKVQKSDSRPPLSPAAAETAAPAGADPNYPTPEAAGTEKLFVVEEPDRGPWVKTAAAPPREQLAWQAHAYCELRETGPACAGAATASSPSLWRIGSRAGKQVVAERVAGGVVQETALYEWTGTRLDRLVRLDGHGGLVSAASFDSSGRQLGVRNLNGGNGLPGCGHLGLKLDGKGRVEELSCLQWSGPPMRDLEGVRVRRFKLDAQGFVVEETRVTPDGSPMADNDGVHRKTYRRDAVGRPLEIRYLDIEGNAVLSTQNGCNGERHRYDRRGFLVERICLGPQGSPMPGRSRASREVYEVDEHGCTQKRRYFDEASKPVATIRGVTEERMAVALHCETVDRTCFAGGVRHACGPNEPSHFVHYYDARGFLSSTQHFDESQGKDVPGADPIYRVFEVRYERDKLGNVVSTACFAAAGSGTTPVECQRSGFHRDRNKIDQAGRTVERRFFGPTGRPAANLGCELRRNVYDNYDHLVQESEHNARGESRETEGMASRRTLFDQSHRRFAVLLYDGQGKPARYRACFMGAYCPLPGSSPTWHAVRIGRAKNGEVQKNLFFDHHGTLIRSVDCPGVQCWD
jgi:hypothetical protein